MFFKQLPVLPGERVEVRELEGARADVELPILREELLAEGFTDDDIRTVSDPRTRRITEVWVRWRSRPHLYHSGPGDRDYQLERARGRLQFGGNGRGLLPPVGNSNVRATLYVAGGGASGNVAAGAINQLLSGAPAIAVLNPRAALGGADSELPAQFRFRGPQVPRHRGRAISALDYEALALEASPGVASVRVLPATSSNGRPDPGSVKVLIVPRSLDRQPWPNYELRRQVHDYLAARAPATVAPLRIAVTGPQYLPVGIRAIVLARDPAESGSVEERVLAALETFLHPVTGGPEGTGWTFGRDVFLSDAAAILEAVDGVDYATELNLLVDDTPAGERVSVPPDRIVVAAAIRIEMQLPEN
jgi:predicted phage baseplate assembly protein